jgi:plastocyanin
MHTTTRRVTRPIGPCALLALLVVSLAACGSSTVSRRVAFVESNGEVRFDSASLTITNGQTVKLTVGNRADTRQEFTIDGLDIERTVEPDSAVTVDIKATKPGTFRMYSKQDRSIDPISIVVPN